MHTDINIDFQRKQDWPSNNYFWNLFALFRLVIT